MKHTVEREIKLRAGDGFALPGDLGEPMAPRRFSSTYHDTPDHRLAASGFCAALAHSNGAGGGACAPALSPPSTLPAPSCQELSR